MKQVLGTSARWLTRRIPPPGQWALLLTLAITLVLAQTAAYDFLFLDDGQNVYQNILVTQFSLDKLALIWSRPYQGLYIPITYSVWGCLGSLASWVHPSTNPSVLSPAVFHTANIVLHLCATLVVFQILRLLLGKDWPAAFGALLFGLHPVQMTSVAWVSGLKQLLSGLLALLALRQYLIYIAKDHAPPRQRLRLYLTAALLFLAALLALPSKANVPLVAAIIAVLAYRRDWRRVALELGPWLLLTAPLILITKELQPSSMLSFVPNLWQRFLIAGDSVTFYQLILFWPFDLGPDYGRDPSTVLSSGYIYLSGLLPYLAGLLLVWRCRDRMFPTIFLAFVAAMLPSLGFIPFGFQNISTVANRYLYFAMLAPAWLAGHLLAKYPGRPANIVAMVLIVLLGARSYDHLKFWHDPITFWQHAVEINPESALAYDNLGLAYLESDRIPEALAAFKASVKFDQTTPVAYINLGDLYSRQGLSDEAKTMYFKALDIDPLSVKILLRLGFLASNQGRNGEAIYFYQKALKTNPNSAKAYAYLGLLYSKLGQRDEAIGHYRHAIKLNPNLGGVHNNLGLLYRMENRQKEAIASFEQAIKLLQDNAEPYNNLATLYIDQKRFEEAIPLLLQAVKLADDQTIPLNNLGMVFQKLGRMQEAERCFSQAGTKTRPRPSRPGNPADTDIGGTDAPEDKPPAG